MGGSKKKSISQAERAQSVSSKGSEKKGRQDISASKFTEFLREIPEPQIIKSLTEIKAVTAYSAAKALNTNAYCYIASERSRVERVSFKGRWVLWPLCISYD